MPAPPPDPPPAGALVLGGSYRALGVVRSLGRRGIPVRVVLADEHRVACASRYAGRSIAWPAGDEDERVRTLLRVAERERLAGWALFPTDDETARLLARRRNQLARRYLVAAPAWAAMQFTYDKRHTHVLAHRLGIAQPRTAFPASRAEVERLDWDFPLVLKPAFKPEANRFTAAKAWRVDDRAALLRGYEEARELVPPGALMVQDLVPGDGDGQLSFAALCHDGEVLACASARRLRQRPMDFGKASSLVETTAEQPDWSGHARTLLRALRFDGLVEVELKRDARDGVVRLLDVNGRVWGWHSVGALAGVDFPYLQWRLLRGEPVEPAVAAAGVRWVRMSTDLPTALGELRRGRLRPRDYRASLRRPRVGPIYAADDRMPALADLPLLATVGARRARRGDHRVRPVAFPRQPDGPPTGATRAMHRAVLASSENALRGRKPAAPASVGWPTRANPSTGKEDTVETMNSREFIPSGEWSS